MSHANRAKLCARRSPIIRLASAPTHRPTHRLPIDLHRPSCAARGAVRRGALRLPRARPCVCRPVLARMLRGDINNFQNVTIIPTMLSRGIL